jgi:hypothetical protein
MGRVVMSCDDVRQALPLLPGTDVEHAARVRAHAVSCETCGELLRTFEADDRLLAAARLDRRAPAVMDGFTASVMARLASEQRRVTPAPAVTPPAGGIVLRPVFFRALAAAAAVLVAVGLGVSTRPGPVVSDEQTVRPSEFAVAPRAGDDRLRPLPIVDVASDPLPAPRLERDPAPMPQRRRGGPVVPVDEGSRRNAGRGRVPGQQGDLFDVLEKVLPNLHQRMMKELGEEQGREVRF